MKAPYHTPRLDVIQFEGTPSINMSDNNLKTFNASNLPESCGYDQVVPAIYDAQQFASFPPDVQESLLGQLSGFEIVAS